MMISRLAQVLGIGAVTGFLVFGQQQPTSQAQAGLQITSPGPNTTVHPGEVVQVSVAASKSYLAVYLVGDNPLGVSTKALRKAPYNLSIQVPASIRPGTYKVTALGMLSTGANDSSPAIVLAVPRPSN